MKLQHLFSAALMLAGLAFGGANCNEFCGDWGAIGNDDGTSTFYHKDEGWTAGFVYLCKNDYCLPPQKSNGYYHLNFSGNTGDVVKYEFKVQDNTVGQYIFTEYNYTIEAPCTGTSSSSQSSSSSVSSSSSISSSSSLSSSSSVSSSSSSAGECGEYGAVHTNDGGIRLWHKDNGWTGQWSYLCIDYYCQPTVKEGDEYAYYYYGNAGSTIHYEFKIQDNATGQYLFADPDYEVKQSCDEEPPENTWKVQPVYLYPSDMNYHAEYEAAINETMAEIQAWYLNKAGVTFTLEPLQVVQSTQDYLTMRCGLTPSTECINTKDLIPNWNHAVRTSVNGWDQEAVTLVFSQGGGGYAGGILYGNWEAYAIVADWVLEPISGLRDEDAIHCGYATWQCLDGTPKGTVAHELGHAFGLHHPDSLNPFTTIMGWHGAYPNTTFQAIEAEMLSLNPFFDENAWVATPGAPWLRFNNTDLINNGATVFLGGRNLSDVVEVEIAGYNSRFTVPVESTSAVSFSFTVPEGATSGYIRVYEADGTASNYLPINILPPQ